MGPEGDSTTEPQLVQDRSTSSTQTLHHLENGVQRIWGKQNASDKKIDSLRIHEIQPFAIDTAVRKIWELQRNTNEPFTPYLSVDVTKKLRKIVLDTLEKCTPNIIRELSFEIPDPQIVQQRAEQKRQQSQTSVSERQARAEAAKKAKEERLRKMREKREAAAKEAKDTTASSTPPEAQEPSLDESENKTSHPEPNPTELCTESPEDLTPSPSLTETKFAGDEENSPPVKEAKKGPKLSVRERVALANASASANRRRPVIARSAAEVRSTTVPVPGPVDDCKPSFFRPSQIKTTSPAHTREPRDARDGKPIYVINSPESKANQNSDSTSDDPLQTDPTIANINSNSTPNPNLAPSPPEPVNTEPSPSPITPAPESKPELKSESEPTPDQATDEEKPVATKPARPALTRPSGKGTFVRPTLSRPTAGGKLPVIKPKASEPSTASETKPEPHTEPEPPSETKPPEPQTPTLVSETQSSPSVISDEALFLSVSADAQIVPAGRRPSLGTLKKFESLPAIQRKTEKDERTLAAMRAFANSRKGGFAASPVMEDDSIPKITVTATLADAHELLRIIEELIHQEFSSEVPLDPNPGPLEFFHASVKGPRPANEDEYAVIEHYNDLFGLPEGAGKYSFAAVYDGHSGKYSSLYVRSQLHYAISNHPEFF